MVEQTFMTDKIAEPEKPVQTKDEIKPKNSHKEDLKRLQKEIRLHEKDERELEKEKLQRDEWEARYIEKNIYLKAVERQFKESEKKYDKLLLKYEKEKGGLLGELIDNKILSDEDEARLIELKAEQKKKEKEFIKIQQVNEKIETELRIKKEALIEADVRWKKELEQRKLEREKLSKELQTTKLAKGQGESIIKKLKEVQNKKEQEISKIQKENDNFEKELQRKKEALIKADIRWKKVLEERKLERKEFGDKLKQSKFLIDETEARGIEKARVEQDKTKILEKEKKIIEKKLKEKKEQFKKLQLEKDLLEARSIEHMKNKLNVVQSTKKIPAMMESDLFKLEFNILRNKIIHNEVDSGRKEYKKLSKLYLALSEKTKNEWWPDVRILFKALSVMRKPGERLSEEQYFYLSDGQSIKDLKELTKVLETLPHEVFEQFVSEEENHFANWIEHVLNSKDLAEKLRFVKTKQEMIDVIKSH